MNRWMQRVAAVLVAVASGCALAAGDSGGTGGRDATYDAGVKAIEHQDWPEAIPQFKTSIARDRFNADAHNWLGYAYRNTGDLNHAFAEYQEALRLDPQHRGAHEYVGEAYVMAKNIPKAREHLAALEKLCGRNGPEYKELDEAISKAGG
jgi:tetratricopeptide (TPR) repeat protein